MKTTLLDVVNIGMTFGDWSVIDDTPKYDKSGNKCLLVQCCCGTQSVVQLSSLRSGDSPHCIHCRCRRNRAKKPDTHGHTRNAGKTLEYNVWDGIVQRCTNPNSDSFKDYGGRGITMCDEWRNSFLIFFTEMGPKPTPRHSIDRIDNEKGYFAGNCRWATRDEQNCHTRRSVTLTYNGKSQCLAHWAKELGMTSSAFGWRLKKGWTMEDYFKEGISSKVNAETT
jgi:hypothetical protein